MRLFSNKYKWQKSAINLQWSSLCKLHIVQNMNCDVIKMFKNRPINFKMKKIRKNTKQWYSLCWFLAWNMWINYATMLNIIVSAYPSQWFDITTKIWLCNQTEIGNTLSSLNTKINRNTLEMWLLTGLIWIWIFHLQCLIWTFLCLFRWIWLSMSVCLKMCTPFYNDGFSRSYILVWLMPLLIDQMSPGA